MLDELGLGIRDGRGLTNKNLENPFVSSVKPNKNSTNWISLQLFQRFSIWGYEDKQNVAQRRVTKISKHV